MVTCSISLLLGGESRTCQLMNALGSCLSSDSVCCLSFNLYSFYKALALKSLYYCWSRLLFTKTQRALPSKSNTRTQQIRYPISPDEGFQLYFLTHKTRQSMMSILVSIGPNLFINLQNYQTFCTFAQLQQCRVPLCSKDYNFFKNNKKIKLALQDYH